MTAPRGRAVALLSGGMDSTVSAAWAVREGYEVHALSVDYGQRHVRELACAEAQARRLGLAGRVVVKLDLRAVGGSALTADIAVPHHRRSASPEAEIPVTYVPARNSVLLSLAMGFAETINAGTLVIGANAVDYSGYPDCRPAFLRAFEDLARVATKRGVEGGSWAVLAPLLHLTKAEIVDLGETLGVDFANTHSCYDPSTDGRACGTCDACRLRLTGFAAAGIIDPVSYISRD